jgi:hypothetical protein
MTMPARYSLEKTPVAAGDKVKALVYCLYAFDGDNVTLLENNNLDTHNGANRYSI